MKLCCRCNTEKSSTEFHKRNKVAGGLQSICKVCRSSMDAESYASNPEVRSKLKALNAKILAENQKLTRRLRKKSGCTVCGEACWQVLEFHHLDPKGKDLAVSALTKGSRKRIVKEIRKCVIVCSNCHRKIHAGLITL